MEVAGWCSANARTGPGMLSVGTNAELMNGRKTIGVVTAVGSKVRDFSIGDAVYARPRDLRIGTFAEFIAVDQADVAHKPVSLSFAEAGAVPLVALAAWQALVDVADVKPGQRVL
ncbi:alcohol dehydrogenase catalytic domain-containing protein, partial [Nocardia sp. NPDC127606]|uniref:alcohol dehydrogenase catalytic domain-containing protein n=1 Tax=Nocardia sp. NPDC127606 TaxID=3345406 RepID=UPI00363BF9EB